MGLLEGFMKLMGFPADGHFRGCHASLVLCIKKDVFGGLYSCGFPSLAILVILNKQTKGHWIKWQLHYPLTALLPDAVPKAVITLRSLYSIQTACFLTCVFPPLLCTYCILLSLTSRSTIIKYLELASKLFCMIVVTAWKSHLLQHPVNPTA